MKNEFDDYEWFGIEDNQYLTMSNESICEAWTTLSVACQGFSDSIRKAFKASQSFNRAIKELSDNIPPTNDPGLGPYPDMPPTKPPRTMKCSAIATSDGNYIATENIAKGEQVWVEFYTPIKLEVSP